MASEKTRARQVVQPTDPDRLERKRVSLRGPNGEQVPFEVFPDGTVYVLLVKIQRRRVRDMETIEKVRRAAGGGS